MIGVWLKNLAGHCCLSTLQPSHQGIAVFFPTGEFSYISLCPCSKTIFLLLWASHVPNTLPECLCCRGGNFICFNMFLDYCWTAEAAQLLQLHKLLRRDSAPSWTYLCVGLKRVTNSRVTKHTQPFMLCGCFRIPSCPFVPSGVLPATPVKLSTSTDVPHQGTFSKLKVNDILQLTDKRFSYQCINLNIDQIKRQHILLIKLSITWKSNLQKQCGLEYRQTTFHSYAETNRSYWLNYT